VPHGDTGDQGDGRKRENAERRPLDPWTIRGRLTIARVSQRAIAAECGVSAPAVAAIISGRSRSARIEEVIARHLGLSRFEVFEPPRRPGRPAGVSKRLETGSSSNHARDSASPGSVRSASPELASVKARLKAAGITQAQIAARCDVRGAMVSQVLSGKARSENVETEIAACLGVTRFDIFPAPARLGRPPRK